MNFVLQSLRGFLFAVVSMELFKRIAKETWLPTCCAIAWGLITYQSQTAKNSVTAVAAAASAFFLVFFFQGQILRIRKNIRDEQNDARTYQGVTSLADAVNEIRTILQGKPPTAPAPPAYSNNFFDLADDALRAGLYYSAVITAAQGFEHEARVAVRALPDARVNIPLGQLLWNLRAQLPKDAIQQLNLLNRTRNTLIHETTPDSISQQQAEELVAGFRDGAEALRSFH